MKSDNYFLYHGDCRTGLGYVPDSSVDSIVTDPPYELGFMGKAWDKSGIAYDVAMWAECLRVLKPGGHLLAFSGTRTYHRMATAIEDAGFEIRDMTPWHYAQGMPKSRNLDGEWEGWGTALKPATEPICVARKPFKGSVANNVAIYGTGALNIDGCRVSAGTPPAPTVNPDVRGGRYNSDNSDRARVGEYVPSELGRWPANVLHDGSPEVLAMFPDAKGQQGDLNETGRDRPSSGRFGDIAPPRAHKARVEDDKSAARFFFCAKASPTDRHEGLDRPGPQFKKGTTLRQVEVAAAAGALKGNTHPTVKPTELMQFLTRLVTPPGGIVLDPFAGSGSTGKACMREGFHFIGFELDAAHIAIADARIKHELLKLGIEAPADPIVTLPQPEPAADEAPQLALI
ncbi:site-specific DNA-methyltransferase [Burkholderia sp. Ac-20349]|uniref:DNA-methyltransferase n=1 Tax=Burkholderia sp. Ac-20349 TaxID=2703893 RepID=UPI00197B5161|nr:site-specific DNA-methyltransferase [Burkholderia sp. Ac-20349]MBN3839297.1 site-specific DNA-methyltransferase [Burkholderia sp. Ac-20349]